MYGLSGVAEIKVGYEHACARTLGGNVWCWGSDLAGQLGDGTTTNRSTPTKVPLVNIEEISLGANHSCARRSDDTVWCWGAGLESIVDRVTDGGMTAPRQRTRRSLPTSASSNESPAPASASNARASSRSVAPASPPIRTPRACRASARSTRWP